MKKFVSMEVINKVFDDLGFIDYVTVSNVTDSLVDLQVHLKTKHNLDPESKDFIEFKERCLVLGKMLDRKIQFSLIPTKFTDAFANRVGQYFRGLSKNF